MAPQVAEFSSYIVDIHPLAHSLSIQEQILVSILGADTRNVDGKIFGTMLISLPADGAQRRIALDFLNAYQGVTAEEVKGNV